jgi:hypothetical protein
LQTKTLLPSGFCTTGYLLSHNPRSWCHLQLPLEYDPNRKRVFNKLGWADPRKVEGQLLSKRFDEDAVTSLKHDLGASNYSAQYNQLPSPASGEVIKREWFRYYTLEGGSYHLNDSVFSESSCWRFADVDLAISQKASADWTVVQVYDVTPRGDVILVQQFRGKIDGTKIIATLKSIYEALRVF